MARFFLPYVEHAFALVKLLPPQRMAPSVLRFLNEEPYTLRSLLSYQMIHNLLFLKAKFYLFLCQIAVFLSITISVACAVGPSVTTSFPGKTQSKASSSVVSLVQNKTIKLPSFIDRLISSSKFQPE
jgi:hypothetical protein